jgi:hypothetical protein
MIRRCFLLVLVSLAGTITSCLLLGIGLYWKGAAVAAVVLFVLAICLLAGTIHYIREAIVALSSVQNEARDSRFMDLGTPAEISSPQSTLSGLSMSKIRLPTRISGDLSVGAIPKSSCTSSAPLFFNIEINLRCRAVFDYLLSVQFHFQFLHPRPLHAPDGLCGLCHRVFSSLREALFGCSHYINNLLRHLRFSFDFSLWIVSLSLSCNRPFFQVLLGLHPSR